MRAQHGAMSYHSTSPPGRVTDIVSAREPAAGATAPPRGIVVHPLVLLGWPGYAIRVIGSRPPRRRLVLRRRKHER
jgi:hypothetical protein